MAMLPFCGYHMGDYFGTGSPCEAAEESKLPRIFYVNWFRQDGKGIFVAGVWGEFADFEMGV